MDDFNFGTSLPIGAYTATSGRGSPFYSLDTSMKTNPYTPPQTRVADVLVDFSPAAPDSQDISNSELAAFYGGPKFPELWLQYIEGKSRLAGFNWWAALFAIQWFFFRKLYLQGIVSLILEVGVLGLFAGTAIALVGKSNNPSFAVVVIFISAIGIRVAIGYWANLALCKKAVRTIRRVDSMNLDNESHLREIRLAGGVSVTSLFAVYAVFGLLRVLPDFLR